MIPCDIWDYLSRSGVVGRVLSANVSPRLILFRLVESCPLNHGHRKRPPSKG